MDGEIELVSDGDGVALFGDPKAIELLLVSEGVESKELDLARMLPSLALGGAALEAGALVAANAGRWVKLSEQSAQIYAASKLMTGSADGLSRAIAVASDGKITNVLEIVTGSVLTNPAVLASVGGLISQYAMQRSIEEIGEYLEVIDRKVDDILRSQKDAVLSDMIAVGLVIDDAMTVREQVGRVSEVTWSKVQSADLTIARTQAYALRQLDALAERLERESKVDDLAKTSQEAATAVQEWLVVIARCFQLLDAIGVLELDRVLDAAPDELDRHRLGLKAARQKRRELISRSTSRLLTRMDAVADLSNLEILANPFNSRALVEGVNRTGAAVVQFHGVLGVVADREALEAKRWITAAVETRDHVVVRGAEGVEAARRFGAGALDRARKMTGKVAGDVSQRLLRADPDEAPRT